MSLRTLTIVVSVILIGVAFSAFAGGPFIHNGVAARWENDTLSWCADTGKLSSGVDNAKAIQWVKDQFDKWATFKMLASANKQVTTSVFKHKQSTDCSAVTEDITDKNFEAMISGDTGPTLVVFDDTGKIFELFGAGYSETILGLTLPTTVDSTGKYITRGFTVFNGKMLTNGKLGTDTAKVQEAFQASMLHELGHLLGLDHSQVNYTIAQNCTPNGQCDGGANIPTMYPYLLTSEQGVLHRDDRVTISWIYPSSDFESEFCTVSGEIFDANERPLKGVNVIASSTSSPAIDSRSFVSGVLNNLCEGDSRYYLHGLVPGTVYKITYEPIGSEFSDESGFEPLNNPPQGFSSGTIKTQDGETTVTCSKGETVEMAPLTIETTNPCASSSNSSTGNTSGSSSSSSSGKSTCSLVGCATDPNILEVLFLVAGVIPLAFARRTRQVS